MATCSTSSLLESACANGFISVAANDELWRRALLQLLKNAAGTSENFDDIWLRACDGGFVSIAANDELWRRTFIALLCNASQ